MKQESDWGNKPFKILSDDRKFIVKSEKKGEVVIYKYECRHSVFESTSSSLGGFFRGYHVGNIPWSYRTNPQPLKDYIANYDQEKNPNAVKEFTKFLEDMYHIAKGEYWEYRKYSFSGVFKDYTKKIAGIKGDYDLRRIKQDFSLFKELEKDLKISRRVNLNLAISTFRKKFKLRKDIFRIVRDKNVLVDEDFLEQYYRDEEFLNEIILKMHELNYWDDLRIRERVWIGQDDTTTDCNNLYQLFGGTMQELQNEHGYTIKAILDQYVNYYGIYEDLTFSTYLEYIMDYASMLKQMDVSKFKKFPRYLKSMHDITAREFKLFKQNYDDQIFYDNINHELEMVHSKFIVETPKKSEDLRREGAILCHCVGSYIDRVIQKKTQICFLREEKDTPLVTVEIKDGRIVQAKGLSNRPVKTQERKYLDIFAKLKNLEIKI
jgi:hypothetical protein